MLQVLMMTSGAEALALTAEEYAELMEGSPGKSSVQALKARLGAVTGLPRFRQRLLRGDAIVGDDDALDPPLVPWRTK